MAAFAQAGCGAAGWLYGCGSGDLGSERVLPVIRHGARLALWRDAAGQPACVLARCPHWGADLGGGTVRGGRLRCPLHGWRYASDGTCVEGPRAHSLTTAEQNGQVFVWWGPEAPLYPLPRQPSTWGRTAFQAVDPQPIAAHPHLATMNGLDLQHWRPVHGLDVAVVRDLAAGDSWSLSCTLRLSGGVARWFGPPMETTITTRGATLCTIESAGWWGRSWTLLSNIELEPGNYAGARQVVACGRWPATAWAILLADALLAGRVLDQDRAALAGWQPQRASLSGPPWDRYLPVVERLPQWSPA
jgi:phenylpropionate dioxygenase-like ring-hydroxylating dioxygenase large terminal subunit